MYEHGMIRPVKNDVQSAIYIATLNADATFVGVYVHLEMLNTSRLHELSVLGRDLLGHEGTGKC